jgi:hypothetical protein
MEAESLRSGSPICPASAEDLIMKNSINGETRSQRDIVRLTLSVTPALVETNKGPERTTVIPPEEGTQQAPLLKGSTISTPLQ